LYLGKFAYVQHSGRQPTDFVMRREPSELGLALDAAERDGEFDPGSIEDGRRKTLAAIVRRNGQPAFRLALFAAYEGRCAVTSCNVSAALEAAHIVPYKGPETNHVTNGLLLRADLHTLFDLGLFAIDELRFTVVIAQSLLGTEYARWSGRKIYLPQRTSRRPSVGALQQHRENAGLKSE
jgi:putative restriction endonuclease